MSESQKLLIELAAHNCEASLLYGRPDDAAKSSEFAFFIATVDPDVLPRPKK